MPHDPNTPDHFNSLPDDDYDDECEEDGQANFNLGQHPDDAPSEDSPICHDYERLSPDVILNAIDDVIAPLGWLTSGHQTALNSYENRVYQIGIEEQPDIIAKFYRPNRWSDATILQEHQFCLTAKQDELPVIAPIQINGETLFASHGFRLALFPKQGGHSGQVEQADEFEQLGRLLARLHQTANTLSFDQRPVMTPTTFARNSRDYLLDNQLIDPAMADSYASISAQVCDVLDEHWARAQPSLKLVHGDLHAGNLIWAEQPYMLDLDDCIAAPRIQDIWMLMHGEREQMQHQLKHIVRGYEMFLPFPEHELPLIEVLRTMRLMHYSAWLAKRMDDPAFKLAFPWFGSAKYWADEIVNLREQYEALQQAPLTLI